MDICELFLFFSILAPVFGRLEIVEGPEETYGALNSPVTLRCRSNNSSARYAWYRNGELLETQYGNPNSLYSLLVQGDLFILTVKQHDPGIYYCNVTAGSESVLSRNATLILANLDEEFRREPEDTYAVKNGNVKLYCLAPLGRPTPDIKWKKEGADENLTGPRFRLESQGNLEIRNVRNSDAGNYWCEATNTAGTRTSPTARISVNETPIIIVSQIDFAVNQGASASLDCEADGKPTPRITWIKNGDLLDRGRSEVDKSNSLHIQDIEPGDEGYYTCLAENIAGSAQEETYLSVNTLPIFHQKPMSKTIATGRDVLFRCVVGGSPPPTLYWQTQHRNSSMLIYRRQSKDRFSVDESGTLRVNNVVQSDQGEYECVAVNSAGMNTVQVDLRVRDMIGSQPPPVITAPPFNVTVGINQDTELRCTAEGDPTPTIRWSHNGRPVLVVARISIYRGNLRITDVMVTDSGEYTCYAISESGEAAASANLSVIGVRNSAVKTLTPPSPGKPVSGPRDITDTSVKMFWESSGDNCNYTVEAFTKRNQGGWKVMVRNIPHSYALIENLIPGAQYVFLVRATNTHGSSEASSLSEYVQTTGGDQSRSDIKAWSNVEIRENLDKFQVDLNSVVVLSSRSLNITWLVDYQYLKYIEGYYLRISSSFQTGPITKTIAGSFSIFHVLDNLLPYTTYHIQMMPYYDSLSGRQSNIVAVRTKEDVPSGPPSKVTLVDKTRYITVSWGPPKESHRNGVIIGYLVVCNAADWRLSRNTSVNVTDMSETSINIKNLKRDKTSYTIGVAARTSVGPGIISHMTTLPQLAPEDSGEPVWLKPTIIGILGGLLFVILLVLILCMYRRKRLSRKAQKTSEKNVVTVPVPAANSPPLFVQYQLDNSSNCQHTLSHQSHTSDNSRHPTGPHGFSPLAARHEYNPDNYDTGNPNSFKTFYNKADDIGPYATTFILSNMPERDESQIPSESPHATMRDGNVQGSSESSCTDNNRAFNSSGEQADRNSPPSLPSFAELLPPPPMYPPPPTHNPVTNGLVRVKTSPQMPHNLITLPNMGAGHCHTCHGGFHGPSMHHATDAQGRPYVPTMPHLHGKGGAMPHQHGEYQATTYSSRGDPAHPYQLYQPCSSHGHSSDSHDYAEPSFDCQQQHLYGMAPVSHQVLPPPHMLQHEQGCSSQHPLHHAQTEPLLQHQQPPQPMQSGGQPTQPRHNSLPSSDHSQDLCPSCAECTEYDEPWSDHPWPIGLDPQQMHQLHMHYNQQHQQAHLLHHQHLLAGNQHEEEGSIGSSVEERSQGGGAGTGQSHSGSEDSKSGRQRQKRRQRAQEGIPRCTSPYNGYSTDSSFVAAPRKPYPKNQRKKQMNKSKNTKSLAVQVEQDEIQQDKV